jgi:hypothetical protein
MTTNLGGFDRATRMTVGIMMTALGLSGTVAGAPGTALVALGAILLVTGILGHCALYRMFGWSTVDREDGSVTSP